MFREKITEVVLIQKELRVVKKLIALVAHLLILMLLPNQKSKTFPKTKAKCPTVEPDM